MDLGFFDWIIMVILAVVIVMILIGKGQEALRFFNGSAWETRKKNPNFNPKREEKATLFFCIVLLVMTAAQHFLAQYWAPLSVISIIVAVAAVAGYMIYITKGQKE
jgi:Na+/proline symporter